MALSPLGWGEEESRRAPSITNPSAPKKWGEKRVDWVNRLLYEATQTKPDCISQEPKSPCLGSSGLGIKWESLHFLSFEANHWLCACTLRGLVSASQVWKAFTHSFGPALSGSGLCGPAAKMGS